MTNLKTALIVGASAFVLISCSSPPRNDEDQGWVYTNGVGNNCSDALRQAKVLAEDSVTGSFLDSRKTLQNDTQYSERVDEFGGGVIRKYEILETKSGSPCVVRIRAVVDPVKSNVAKLGASTTVDLADMVGLVNKQDDARKMLRMLIDRPEMFTVKLNQLSVLSAGAGYVRVGYDITSVTVAPKWYSDLESFFSVQGKRVTYKSTATLESLGESLATVVASPVLVAWAIIFTPFSNPSSSNETFNPDNAICFWSFDGKDTVNCYQSWLAAEAKSRLARVHLFQQVGGSLSTDSSQKLLVGSFPLVSNMELPALYKSGNSREQYLPIVAPIVGLRVSQQVPKQMFEGDAKLQVGVGFAK